MLLFPFLFGIFTACMVYLPSMAASNDYVFYDEETGKAYKVDQNTYLKIQRENGRRKGW